MHATQRRKFVILIKPAKLSLIIIFSLFANLLCIKKPTHCLNQLLLCLIVLKSLKTITLSKYENLSLCKNFNVARNLTDRYHRIMFTIEHEFDATVVTLIDEGTAPLTEDVTINIFASQVNIEQLDIRTDTVQKITLSLSQLRELEAALDLPEGSYQIRMR
jgi:hypothetical protein